MSDTKPYALTTFEAEFCEKVSVHDVPSDVIERLLATVRALDEKTIALEMAQIAINAANTKRDEIRDELRLNEAAHDAMEAERDALRAQLRREVGQ
jgi:hypothetical protein